MNEVVKEITPETNPDVLKRREDERKAAEQKKAQEDKRRQEQTPGAVDGNR